MKYQFSEPDCVNGITIDIDVLCDVIDNGYSATFLYGDNAPNVNEIVDLFVDCKASF